MLCIQGMMGIGVWGKLLAENEIQPVQRCARPEFSRVVSIDTHTPLQRPIGVSKGQNDGSENSLKLHKV